MLTPNNDTLSLYNLFHPQTLADPYPFYHRLRSEDPVHWDAMMRSWIVTRYIDVVAALQDSHLSEERISPFVEQLLDREREKMAPLAQVLMRMMLFLDPPDHTRLRGFVNRAFTPHMMRAMRSRIQQLVDELLDTVQDAGRMDVIYDFSLPLSAAIIADLLDVPEEDRGRFKDWTSLLKGFFSQSAREVENVVDLKVYFGDIISKRRPKERETLIDVLIDARDRNMLTFDEMFSIYVLLFDAGQVTTANLIGNGLLALIRHPDQLEKLRDNPSLIVSAVTEMLRYEGPVQFTTRIAKADFNIGGKQISKGQSVTLMLGAANRDPEQFRSPDKLDISRKENRHIAFGYGLHFCIGASLAQIEAQIAIGELLRRAHTISLDSEPKWQENINFRFLESLPITFKPSLY